MQEFEGVNYKEEKARKAREAIELQQLMALELVNHVANSMGTRERNRPAHLEEADAARESMQVSMRPPKAPRSMKLPKSMRLPRMQPWYFYDSARLIDLQGMLEEQFEIKKAQAMHSHGAVEYRVERVSDLLPLELAQERKQLIAAGFPTWNRDDMLHFVSACARNGRGNWAKTAADLKDYTVEEVKA